MQTSNTAIEPPTPTPITAPQPQLDQPIPFQEYQTLQESKTFQEVANYVTNTIGNDPIAANYWNQQKVLIFWWPDGNAYSIQPLKDIYGKPRATYFGLGLTMAPPGSWEELIWSMGYRYATTQQPPDPTIVPITTGGSMPDSSEVQRTSNTVGDPRATWTPRQFYQDYVDRTLAQFPTAIPQIMEQSLPVAFDAAGNAIANPAWVFSINTAPTYDQQYGTPDALVPGSLDHPSVSPNPGKGNVTNFALTPVKVGRTGNQITPPAAKIRTQDTIYTPGGFLYGASGAFKLSAPRQTEAPQKMSHLRRLTR